MIMLKSSEFIELELDICDTIDMSVRQYEDQDRIIYLGQDSQVIQFSEKELDKVINFLMLSKALELTTTKPGFLK